MGRKVLQPFNFSPAACRAELIAFERLQQAPELSEKNDILPFFEQHSHVSALIGMLNRSIGRIDLLANEYDIFGDFRTDLVVGDSAKHAFTLVEFEDARADSIFHAGDKYTAEWSPRFEHGYSQLVDWFWKINDLERTDDFAKRFGSHDATFFGMLVVGRRRYLDKQAARRLHWRANKVIVNSNQIRCLTFDDLYDELSTLLSALEALAGATADPQ